MTNELVKVRRETDEAKKKEIEEKLGKEILPVYLKQFETKLAQSSSGFMIGDSLTWVDLYFTVLLEWLGEKKDALLAFFPKAKALDEKIRGHPKIAEWIAKRPVTSF